VTDTPTPLALLLLAALTSSLNAQVARVSSGDGFDFTIKNIMRGPELYGRAPTNVRWSADGRWIYFQWNAPGTIGVSRFARIACARPQ